MHLIYFIPESIDILNQLLSEVYNLNLATVYRIRYSISQISITTHHYIRCPIAARLEISRTGTDATRRRVGHLGVVRTYVLVTTF